MSYQGSIDLISGIRPKNNGKFALVNAKDIYIDDETRLSDLIASLLERIEFLEDTKINQNTASFGYSMFGSAIFA